MNMAHPFFLPYLNIKGSLELIQKFVISLALAERMARKIYGESLVAPDDFRNFMNKVLRYSSEIEANYEVLNQSESIQIKFNPQTQLIFIDGPEIERLKNQYKDRNQMEEAGMGRCSSHSCTNSFKMPKPQGKKTTQPLV